MDSSELQAHFANTPSYLKELLRQNEEICLVYKEVIKILVMILKICFFNEFLER